MIKGIDHWQLNKLIDKVWAVLENYVLANLENRKPTSITRRKYEERSKIAAWSLRVKLQMQPKLGRGQIRSAIAVAWLRARGRGRACVCVCDSV